MSSYVFTPFVLDPGKRLLFKGADVMPLTPKAFEVLLILVENHGKVVDKDTILDRVWPESDIEENNLTVNISHLRKIFGENQHDHKFIVTIPGRGYQFVADVIVTGQASRHQSGIPEEAVKLLLETEDSTHCDEDTVPSPQQSIDLTGGALPIGSLYYIERPVDYEFYNSIHKRESIILIKGARQVGKTSLLARGLQSARQGGARVVITDFQNFNSVYLASVDRFFLMLAEDIANQLELSVRPSSVWNEYIGPGSNFENYWRKVVLGTGETHLVWGLDEVDILFNCRFGSEVFGLFRSWHNKRALDPQGPWKNLTLAIAYASEAHLFISDLNQSPFNVGSRLQLEDFNYDQIEELNHRFGSPIKSDNDLKKLCGLLGGHPFILSRALWEICAHGIEPADIIISADDDEGIFGDNLHRVFVTVSRDQELLIAVKEILQNGYCRHADSFYRLRSTGIISGHSPKDAGFRCELYRIFLQDRLK